MIYNNLAIKLYLQIGLMSGSRRWGEACMHDIDMQVQCMGEIRMMPWIILYSYHILLIFLII